MRTSLGFTFNLDVKSTQFSLLAWVKGGEYHFGKSFITRGGGWAHWTQGEILVISFKNIKSLMRGWLTSIWFGDGSWLPVMNNVCRCVQAILEQYQWMMESCFRSSETWGQVGNIWKKSSEVATEPKGTCACFWVDSHQVAHWRFFARQPCLISS